MLSFRFLLHVVLCYWYDDPNQQVLYQAEAAALRNSGPEAQLYSLSGKDLCLLGLGPKVGVEEQEAQTIAKGFCNKAGSILC